MSYLAAGGFLILGLLLIRGQPVPWSALLTDRSKARWFVYGSVGVFFAQFFRYLALAYSPVSLVVPLTHTRPLFTVSFSYIFNRELESFSRSTLVGVGFSVLGALAIGLGTL